MDVFEHGPGQKQIETAVSEFHLRSLHRQQLYGKAAETLIKAFADTYRFDDSGNQPTYGFSLFVSPVQPQVEINAHRSFHDLQAEEYSIETVAAADFQDFGILESAMPAGDFLNQTLATFDPLLDRSGVVIVIPVAPGSHTLSVRQYAVTKTGNHSQFTTIVSGEGRHSSAQR